MAKALSSVYCMLWLLRIFSSLQKNTFSVTYVLCKYWHPNLSPNQTRKIVFNDLNPKDWMRYSNLTKATKRTRHANYFLIILKQNVQNLLNASETAQRYPEIVWFPKIFFFTNSLKCEIRKLYLYIFFYLWSFRAILSRNPNVTWKTLGNIKMKSLFHSKLL